MEKKKPKPPQYSKEKLKQMRGIQIAESGGVKYIRPFQWRVVNKYIVNKTGTNPETDEDEYDCSCPDFMYRGFDEKNFIFHVCKHIEAVKHFLTHGDKKLT